MPKWSGTKRREGLLLLTCTLVCRLCVVVHCTHSDEKPVFFIIDRVWLSDNVLDIWRPQNLSELTPY